MCFYRIGDGLNESDLSSSDEEDDEDQKSQTTHVDKAKQTALVVAK